jgi:hypothetical protein
MTYRAKLSALSLTLHMACGGMVEREPGGITALCVTECLRFDDGHRECITLTSPEQLQESWWEHVTAVECSSPCPAQQVEAACGANYAR